MRAVVVDAAAMVATKCICPSFNFDIIAIVWDNFVGIFFVVVVVVLRFFVL